MKKSDVQQASLLELVDMLLTEYGDDSLTLEKIHCASICAKHLQPMPEPARARWLLSRQKALEFYQ